MCYCHQINPNYKCNICLVKEGNYKWCVITEVDKTSLADDVITFNREQAKEFICSGRAGDFAFRLEGWREQRQKLYKHGKDEYGYPYQAPIFEPGEYFMVDPYFEREIQGQQRKPSKWLVEYELVDTLQEAVEKSFEINQRSYE